MLLENERNYVVWAWIMVTVCFWNTNGIMVWAWMHWRPYALGKRTELWFGHGCSGDRLLLEHERYHCFGMDVYERKLGLGMDALFAVCSWNTSGI